MGKNQCASPAVSVYFAILPMSNPRLSEFSHGKCLAPSFCPAQPDAQAGPMASAGPLAHAAVRRQCSAAPPQPRQFNARPQSRCRWRQHTWRPTGRRPQPASIARQLALYGQPASLSLHRAACPAGSPRWQKFAPGVGDGPSQRVRGSALVDGQAGAQECQGFV